MAAPIITDPGILEAYLTDASNVRGHAEGLFRPRSADEVADVLRSAQHADVPVTVSAGRTSTTASAVPMGGWVLSTERLNAIHDIGRDRAIADGGVFLGAFQARVEAAGRFFPPDPTSRHECTLGAAIATNASGARSFRYGPTRPWVETLQVVLPTGQILEMGPDDPVPASWPVPTFVPPPVKTAAGYEAPRRLVDLFVGQEGTLGVITRAVVRLVDLPAEVTALVAWFRTRQDAVCAVQRLRASSRSDPRGALSPRCIEYLDPACLDLARERGVSVPADAGVALFCEQEGTLSQEEHLSAWWDALAEAQALVDETLVVADDRGRADLHALRHAIPAGINEKVVRNGMPKVGTDLSVPDAALSEMMDAYEAAPVEHVLFGHIGDNHLHLNLLPRTPEELALARRFYDELARKALALGGSVSGEHGIGRLKKRQLEWMVPARHLQAFRALKEHLDPNWILGRGVMFDRVSQPGDSRWEGV